MRIAIDTGSVADYERFLKVKTLPKYTIRGGFIEFPDEYADSLGLKVKRAKSVAFKPSPFLFDYQRDIAALAVRKKRFSVFADCGLGKTLILLDFARHVESERGGRVLVVSPLMVIDQTIAEARAFYGDSLPIARIPSSQLDEWLRTGSGIGITNYEAINDDLPESALSGLLLDESSMLKSHYGAWGTRLIQMGRGVEYKLCLTGTPAPNDRIEYANHAVFMDAFPNVNSFLARFFVNRGQTSERWEMKKHALGAFYTALSHWCIFLTRPSVYGWKDGCADLPPIHVHVHRVPLTQAQRSAFMDDSGSMFLAEAGGIGSRSRYARIGKGFHNGEAIESNKTAYITDLIASWPDESTIIWCKYNQEQDAITAAIPGCVSIDGSTPEEKRREGIEAFKSGRSRVLVSKPKILGFGLNLQVATRQIFSGLQDSYEEFYQAVKRSNRYGSTRPLNVHIPVTELEEPMIQTVLSKADRVQRDTEEQERAFREHASIGK